MPSLSRYDLTDVVETRLKTIENATGYRSQIPETPDTLSPTDPRVLPYWVLWPTPGSDTGLDTPMTSRVDEDILWRFTVTCTAGVSTANERLVDTVLALLNGWDITVEGFATGRCALDYNPGPARTERSPMPERFVLPLPFVIRLGY